jgi:alpha-galactosidase
MQSYERIDGGGVTFAVAWTAEGAPRLLHFGARLPAGLDLRELDEATARGPRESTPDAPIPPSLFPAAGFGWPGEAAVAGMHADGDSAIDWSDCSVNRRDAALHVRLVDGRTRLRAELEWSLDPQTGVLTSEVTLCNDASTDFQLKSLASIFLPLADTSTDVLAFDGDWSREMRPVRFAAPPGAWSRTNRSGRTGFAGATFAVLSEATDDAHGDVTAVHLAWSSNHRLMVETLAGGQRLASAGISLEPGEIVIPPGGAFAAPTAYAGFSAGGFNGISDAFHPFVRRSILPRGADTIRKVHFNSWEASYFDFNEGSLKDLASAAATLGVERFVLDDGWFSGRRNDTAGLGDWRVDPAPFPDGLNPLIDHIHRLGMDFGLWVEPEMVNPDSDLYRQHPDWCVHADGARRPTMRNQLWLDMSREDVSEYLFRQLDALLTRHAIAYLKWDCNRFLFPTTSAGRPAAHAVQLGTYALFDRLRAAHPDVEIETCASGGARIDLEILKRATRVWPSDTTDAIERLRIQRWASLILPLEAIGAHIGPSPNPITGRRIDMAFRARVAMFGHLGIEMDPRKLSSEDSDVLAAHIALYKRHRMLIHSGRHLRWTTSDGAEARMVIAPDHSQALLLGCRTDVAARAETGALRLPGLNPDARYRVMLPEPWPKIAARRLSGSGHWREGRVFTGATLASVGLVLPLADPETAWLAYLVRL